MDKAQFISAMITGLVQNGAPMAATEITTPLGDFWLVVMTPEAYQRMESKMILDPRGIDPDSLPPSAP